jgi:ADP-ribose pyrophosphatase YjhB (NUDIX family)
MSPKMIVCALPYSGDDVLLVKYRDMPDHQSGWFVPHVMLNEKEHPEDAAKRALTDQFGMRDPKLQFSHFESFTGRDGSWHLIFHFKSKQQGRELPKASDDLAPAEWFARTKLPPTKEISHHGWAADIVERCFAQTD